VRSNGGRTDDRDFEVEDYRSRRRRRKLEKRLDDSWCAGFLMLQGSGLRLMDGGTEGAVRVDGRVVVMVESQGESEDDQERRKQEGQRPARQNLPAGRSCHSRNPAAHSSPSPSRRSIRIGSHHLTRWTNRNLQLLPALKERNRRNAPPHGRRSRWGVRRNRCAPEPCRIADLSPNAAHSRKRNGPGRFPRAVKKLKNVPKFLERAGGAYFFPFISLRTFSRDACADLSSSTLNR